MSVRLVVVPDVVLPDGTWQRGVLPDEDDWVPALMLRLGIISVNEARVREGLPRI